jgi:surface protein
MECMFSGCNSLTLLPDLSKWNTSNVTNMSYMFSACNSLISLPDISKWNINNATNMSYMFDRCISLISIPDLSKWDIDKINNMSKLFFGCPSLLYLFQKLYDNYELNRKNSSYFLDDNIPHISLKEKHSSFNEKVINNEELLDQEYIEMFENYMHGDKSNNDENDYSDLLDL